MRHKDVEFLLWNTNQCSWDINSALIDSAIRQNPKHTKRTEIPRSSGVVYYVVDLNAKYRLIYLQCGIAIRLELWKQESLFAGTQRCVCDRASLDVCSYLEMISCLSGKRHVCARIKLKINPIHSQRIRCTDPNFYVSHVLFSRRPCRGQSVCSRSMAAFFLWDMPFTAISCFIYSMRLWSSKQFVWGIIFIAKCVCARATSQCSPETVRMTALKRPAQFINTELNVRREQAHTHTPKRIRMQSDTHDGRSTIDKWRVWWKWNCSALAFDENVENRPKRFYFLNINRNPITLSLDGQIRVALPAHKHARTCTTRRQSAFPRVGSSRILWPKRANRRTGKCRKRKRRKAGK